MEIGIRLGGGMLLWRKDFDALAISGKDLMEPCLKIEKEMECALSCLVYFCDSNGHLHEYMRI